MVTLVDAMNIIGAAQKKAEAIGQPMNIAVADAGGNLVAHVRMDGAWIGSIDISIKKAFTARAFDIATKDLAPLAQPGGDFFGIHAPNMLQTREWPNDCVSIAHGRRYARVVKCALEHYYDEPNPRSK